jgi:hypothetical protein
MTDFDRLPPADNIVDEAAAKFSNWGRWGEDDELGTVNFVTPEIVAQASSLVRKGKTFSLAIPVGSSGPQTGHLGRFNPIHFMMRDGDDAFARSMPGVPRGIGGADDAIMIATHSATHWDALSHMFLDGQMWNGVDCRHVNSFGADQNDITKYKDRIVGRCVLLDFPRYFGLEWCPPGQAITTEDVVGCAKSQGGRAATRGLCATSLRAARFMSGGRKLGHLRRRGCAGARVRDARLGIRIRDRRRGLGYVGR